MSDTATHPAVASWDAAMAAAGIAPAGTPEPANTSDGAPHPAVAAWDAAMKSAASAPYAESGSPGSSDAAEPTASGIGRNVAAGAAEGVGDIGDTIGAGLSLTNPLSAATGIPVQELASHLHDLVAPLFGHRKLTTEEHRELLDAGTHPGTALVNAAARAVGAPTPQSVTAGTPEEEAARGIARMGTGAALMGPMEGVGALAGRFAAGAGAYGGGKAADALVPAPSEWRPLAEQTGQLIGGAGVAGAEAGARALARGAGDVARSAIAPLSVGRKEALIDPATGEPVMTDAAGVPVRATPAQQRLAAQVVAQKASAIPGDLAAQIPGREEYTLVPGSTPTMGQVLGNTGLLGFERQLQNSTARAAMTDAGSENNAARRAALEGLAPADAATAMREYVLGHLRDLRQQAAEHEDAAQSRMLTGTADLQRQAQENAQATGQRAAAAMDAIGGAAQPGDYGQEMREHITSQFAPALARSDADIAGARAATEGALAQAGGSPDTTSAQAVGAGQREALEAQRGPAKTAAGRLYDAIDPDGTLAIDARSLGAAARDIQRGVGLGGALSAAERVPLEAAAGISGVTPFNDLRTLASNVGGAMRAISRDPQLGRESQPYRRMAQLQGAVESAIAEAAGQQAEEHAGAVAAGTMRPEDAISARIRGRVDQHNDGSAPGATQAATGTWDGYGQGNSESEGVGAPRIPGETGAAGPKGSGLGNAPGDPELSPAQGAGPPSPGSAGLTRQALHGTAPKAAATVARMPGVPDLKANFNDAAATRLKQANVAYRAYKERFRTGVVGEALQSGQDISGFRLAPSAVPAKLFPPGPRGAEAADSLIRAAGSVEDAQSVLGEGPAHSLRLAAETNGVLNAEKYQRWMAAHAPILDKFPALRAKFESIGRAQETLDNALARRREMDSAHPLAGAGTNAELATRYWRPGTAGGDAVRTYLRDTGATPGAIRTLDDFAAYSLRRDAFKNGEWNEAGYQSWLKRFDPALKARPELAQRLGTFADAQRAVGEAAEADRARLESFQSHAAAEYLGRPASDAELARASRHLQNPANPGPATAQATRADEFASSPARHYLGRDGEGADLQTAVGRLLGSDNPAREAADLMRRAAGNDAAIDGIRRNVVEWMIAKANSTAEAGTSGQKEIAGGVYQRTLADPKTRRALEVILTPAQIRVMEAVGKDIERADRAVNAVKIKGSPGTAADLHALEQRGGMSMFVQMILGEHAGELLGHMAKAGGAMQPLLSAAGAVGGVLTRAARAAGYEKVDQIAMQMILRPEFGRALLQKAVPTPRASILRQAVDRLVGASGASVAQENGRDR